MCERCNDGHLGWDWNWRLDAFILTCSGCGYVDEATATQDPEVTESVLYM